MAINLGNVKVADLSENAHKILGIGINRASKNGGAFDLNYTTIKQARSNLINLILTKKGERLGQPDFGCDIWRILFEPIIEGEIESNVEQSIMNAVGIWLPYIQIDQIFLDYDENDIDRNGFRVEVAFSLASNPNINDTVTVNVQS
jgi:phage baseplate assembly protein W